MIEQNEPGQGQGDSMVTSNQEKAQTGGNQENGAAEKKEGTSDKAGGHESRGNNVKTKGKVDAKTDLKGGRRSASSKSSRSRSRSRDRKRKKRSHSRRHSRSRSPRRRHHDRRRPREIEMPGLDGPLLSLRDFMQRQRESVSCDVAEQVYDTYKKKWESKQNDIFCQEHAHDEWFKEKYHPIFAGRLNQERKQNAQKFAEKFGQLFVSGAYDAVSFDVDERYVEIDKLEEESNMMNDDEESGANRKKLQSPYHRVFLKESVDITAAPFYGFDPYNMTLFIRQIPSSISRWDIEEAVSKIPGYVSLSLSEPLKNNEFGRLGWILFDSEANCGKAQDLLQNLTIKEKVLYIHRSKGPRKELKVLTNVTKEKIEDDCKLALQLMECLDREKNIANNPLTLLADQKYTKAQQLDLRMLYLRKVHSMCYYCGIELHDERLLTGKCGSVHLRKIKPTDSVEEEKVMLDHIPDWHKHIREQIKKRIDESAQQAANPNAAGTESADKATEEVEKFIEDYVSNKYLHEVDEGKWGCLFCDKFFAGQQFIMKHIKNKHEGHSEWERIRNKCIDKIVRKNYAKDPARIMNPSPSYYKRTPGGGGYPNNRGGRGRYDKDRERDRDYKDLDDPNAGGAGGNQATNPQAAPKAPSGPPGRMVIDYGDL